MQRWRHGLGAVLALALVALTLVPATAASAADADDLCTPQIHYMAQTCRVPTKTVDNTVSGYADLMLRWDASHTHISGTICIHDTLSNGAGVVVNLRALRASNVAGDAAFDIGYWRDGTADCNRPVSFAASEPMLEISFRYGDSRSGCPLYGISPGPLIPYCYAGTTDLKPVADRRLDMAPFIGGGYLTNGCTTGFVVDGLGNRRFVVSAAHCNFGRDVFEPRGQLGTLSTARTDHDIALIETTEFHQGFGMIFDGPTVNDSTNDSVGFYKQVTGTRFLTSTDLSSLSLCTSGATSGVHCGYVLQNIDVDRKIDGVVHDHMEVARKNNDHQCVQKGDSGGPVFVTDGSLGVKAVGIISATSEDADYCWLDFQDFGTIMNDFGVVPSTRTPTGGHDITSDGDVDVVAIRPSDGYLARWPGNGKGGFDRLQNDLGPGWGSYRDLAEGDVNGDGFMDLVAIRASDGYLARWDGNGAGGFNYIGTVGGGWNSYTNLVSADINGDGKTDLMAIRTSDGMLARWLGNGSGGFSYMGSDLGPGWGAYTSLAAGDINGDFKPDLVAIRSSDGHLARWYGNGNSGFTYAGNAPYLWGGYRDLVIGDYNADGKGDLLAVRPGGVLERYFGDGAGAFTYQSDVGPGWDAYRDLQ
jgi:hypothetical protein